MQEPEWITTARGFLMALMLGALPLPVDAEMPDEPALAAVYSACASGPATMKSRMEILGAAGWVFASDSPTRSDLHALFMVALSTFDGEPVDCGMQVFLSARDKQPRPLRFPAGSGVDAEAIVAVAERYGQLTVTGFDLPNAAVILDIRLVPTSRLKKEYGLICQLLLSEPVPAAMLDRLVPAGLDLAVVEERDMPDALHMRVLSYQDGSGHLTQLTHQDMTAFPNVMALPSLAGSPTKLSTLLELATGPVHLR